MTDLALLKITALEAVKQGLDQTEDFKKREPLFHKLAFLGALERDEVELQRRPAEHGQDHMRLAAMMRLMIKRGRQRI